MIIAQQAGAVNTTLFRSAFKADLGLHVRIQVNIWNESRRGIRCTG
jgi:hypothetical protein